MGILKKKRIKKAVSVELKQLQEQQLQAIEELKKLQKS